MANTTATSITVSASMHAPIEKVWKYWTEPDHITKWNFASDDWHSPAATNNPQAGGRFSYRMESKNGEMGFDFDGVYTEVIPYRLMEYRMSDGRRVRVTFEADGNETRVTETFEAETIHSHDMQRAGWQAILDNFKRHVENH